MNDKIYDKSLKYFRCSVCSKEIQNFVTYGVNYGGEVSEVHSNFDHCGIKHVMSYLVKPKRIIEVGVQK